MIERLTQLKEAVLHRNALEHIFHRFPWSNPALRDLERQEDLVQELAIDVQIQSLQPPQQETPTRTAPQDQGGSSLSRTEAVLAERSKKHPFFRKSGGRGRWDY
jgi:hypothetical protein